MMKIEEADHLGKRIINTMRQTPALSEWRDVLRQLHYQRALATFELCRATVEDSLPIARFLAAYRQQPTDNTHRPPCPTCDGEGYLRVYFERNGYEYVGLSVCRDCGGTYNPPDEPLVPAKTGRQIAYQAYVEECISRGRKPDPDWFRRLMAPVEGRVTTALRLDLGGDE